MAQREVVEALQSDHSVRQICETLGINRSNLYYHPKSDPCEEVLREEMEKLAPPYPKYGYKCITQLLLRRGYPGGYKRVARLMKSANLDPEPASGILSHKCITRNDLIQH